MTDMLKKLQLDLSREDILLKQKIVTENLNQADLELTAKHKRTWERQQNLGRRSGSVRLSRFEVKLPCRRKNQQPRYKDSCYIQLIRFITKSQDYQRSTLSKESALQLLSLFSSGWHGIQKYQRTGLLRLSV